jgi:LPS-assembly lipoprotein
VGGGSWATLLVLILALTLAACGYRPLYGERGPNNASVVDELALVRIESIPDRIGQQMYNMLRERLNPYGKPADPKYVLSVTLLEKRDRLFFEKDETATRANLTLKANFTLRRISDGVVVATGLSRAVSSYDILGAGFEYASVVSEEDARVRGAQALTEDIRTRLALALSNEI